MSSRNATSTMDSTTQPQPSMGVASTDELSSVQPSQRAVKLATGASQTDASSSQPSHVETEPTSQTQAASSTTEPSALPAPQKQPEPPIQSTESTAPGSADGSAVPTSQSAPTSSEPAAPTLQTAAEPSIDAAQKAAEINMAANVTSATQPSNESSAVDPTESSADIPPPTAAATVDASSRDANAGPAQVSIDLQDTSVSASDNTTYQNHVAPDSAAQNPSASVSTAEPAISTTTSESTNATVLPATQPADASSAPSATTIIQDAGPKSSNLVDTSLEQGKVADTGTALSDDANNTKPAESNAVAPGSTVNPASFTSTTAGAKADSAVKTTEGTAVVEAASAEIKAATESNQQSAEAAATQTGVAEGIGSTAASNEPAASAAKPTQEAKSNATDPETSSKDNEAAAPAEKASTAAAEASAPATPDKKSKTDETSAGPTALSSPSTPAREGRVALILRINKELIRLCVELQSKELATDPVYRGAAVRLQANLGYLAGIADKSGKPNDPNRATAPSAALPKLDPFPRSEHAPSSPLPALYDKLIAIFGMTRTGDPPIADGRKRSRDSTADLGGEDARKRAASKGIDRSQDVSAAGSPTSCSNVQTGSAVPCSKPVDNPTAPAPTNAVPAAASKAQNQASQQQQPHAAQQQSQQQSQQQQQQQQPPQQGKGLDLSQAPPVPIAPPAAAQNIPNNPQAQALMQAFGLNALVNLHALQSHLRGQGTHAWVAFMEANVAGFKAMPLQVQLQHMTSLQNAAQQRQKSMQAGGGPGWAGPTTGIGSPATMMPNSGIGGAASSPANTRPVSRHSDSPSQAQASPSASGFVPGRTGTPSGGQAAFQNRPGSSGSVGSMTSAGGRNRTGSSHLAFDPSQMQSAPSPATMASVSDFAGGQQQSGMTFGFQPPGLQQGSPAAASSPAQQGQPQQPQQQPQPGQQGTAPGMMTGGMGMNTPNFQNLPPHLQQQIRQQYMAHLQAQAQAQGMNPQSGFNPQQQQQQPQQQPQQQQGWNLQSPQ
ncbi:uncharacterized protein UDID_20969 [Ustilago sp. UG-2017a]|nr:uncharacterized protein UDID_20969 [Ustilago sp. UG-2017a]